MSGKPAKLSARDVLAAAADAARRREQRDGPDLRVSTERERALARARVVVVAAAMNNAPLWAPFWRSLQGYCAHRGAELAVVPIRYRNPRSREEAGEDADDWWWPREVEPYLVGSAVRLHRHLILFGDVRVQATALHPLTGLEGFGHGCSAIFPHSQVAMRSVPTPHLTLPKIMHTTGSLSEPRYSDSKAGAIGAFHHTQAALVVEKQGDRFYLRLLAADAEGGFVDLDRYYHPSGHREAPPAEALEVGDAHVLFADPRIVRATFHGPDSIVGTVRPRVVYVQDVIDSYAISHHHERDPFVRLGKWKAGRGDLLREMREAAAFLADVARLPGVVELRVKASNHHEHVARWVRESDWRRDPENAEVYLELALAMARSATFTRRGVEYADPWALWTEARLREMGVTNVRFLGRDESSRVLGIEHVFHGDRGPSGARGSVRNLARIGTRVVSGHGHEAAIEKGHFRVSSLYGDALPTYTSGHPNAWISVHCVTAFNGRRQMLTVVRDDFRARDPR